MREERLKIALLYASALAWKRKHNGEERVYRRGAVECYATIEFTASPRTCGPIAERSVFLNPVGSDRGGEVHGLTRFEDLFGDGPNRIPWDQEIEEAKFAINVEGPSSNAHEITSPCSLAPLGRG